MFKTDIGHSFRVLFETHRWGTDSAVAFSLAGVEACWLPEAARADLRRDFERQITALEIEYRNSEARH
jgi:adenosine deaminase